MLNTLSVSVFQEVITPPLGYPLCAGWYPSASAIEHDLLAEGIIVQAGAAPPVVICVLDWAELSNREHDRWRQALARAAGTSPDRVSVHCVHCHDTPWLDRDAQALLDEAGYPGVIMDVDWSERVRERVAASARQARSHPAEVTEVRAGRARITGLASNRRILGSDGKSKGVRWTRCRDESLRNEPEGVIDPDLKTISFWSGAVKIAALHFYAVHPTSYDGTGMVNADFVGLARNRLAREEGVPHLYLTECAGNITAGKYNEGDEASRVLFADKLYQAMITAEAQASPVPLESVLWRTVRVRLRAKMGERDETLWERLRDPAISDRVRSRTALELAYRNLDREGRCVAVSALHLGEKLVILHLPGEAFIEYQLEAQRLRPDAQVVAPAYGDCGPGYIPLKASYAEGGYEPDDAFCSPASEVVMRGAIRTVLFPALNP